MAQIRYRANLTSAAFPFRSQDFGQSVIIKQYDQNYTPSVTASTEKDQDIGIPQLIYAHNVMPVQAGMQSVALTQKIAQISPTENQFLQVVPVRNVSLGAAVLLGFCGDGRVFISFSPFNSWSSLTFLANTGGKRITYGQVNGETYIYVYKSGCYKLNFNTTTLESVELLGLDPSTIVAVTAYGGYLIAASSSGIFWSSTLDVTDFVPDLATGAGGGELQEAKGDIVVLVQTLSGFLIYTSGNVVAGVASNNARYPFNFRALAGSGGVSDSKLVTFSENVAAQYAYTTVGLIQVSPLEAKPLFPEVTDFISGNVFEDFDSGSNLITTVSVGEGTMQKRLTLVASRYLVISYGLTEFTHALIYDVALRRWGKLKISHSDCFDLSIISALTTETPKDAIAFLLPSGEVRFVDYSVFLASDAVAMFGKYQVVRARTTQLNEVEVENIRPELTCEVYALPALDGKNYTVESGELIDSEGLYRSYGFRSVGKNVSLLFKGAFSITSLQLNFTPHGKR